MDAPKSSPAVDIHPSLSPSLAASNAPRPSPSAAPSPADLAAKEGSKEPVQGQEWYDPSKESWATRLGVNWESFKRAPGATAGLEVVGGHVDPLKPVENPMLQQRMKPRHLQMIAVGGSIGTGLFIASGQALKQAGPLGVLIAWVIVGVMLLNITQALGELAIVFPVSGGWSVLAVRFVDRSFGAAVSYNYAALWCVVLPLELTAAAIAVQYWEAAAKVPVAVWITVFYVAIIILNVFGTLGYAEEEFWASLLKLGVVVVFIIIGIVLNCGGGKNDYSTYVGGRYWRDPGPLADGFHGVAAVFVTAAFSFAGTELVGLAATETKDPRRSLPSAIKSTFWRVTVIYVCTLLIIGLNLPYDNPRLLGGGSDAGASPFVIMVERAGLKGLDHLINVTICISVMSVGLASCYAGSRIICALAETGFLPRQLAYVDKSGRPLYATLFVLACGPIAYVNCSSSGETVFNWLKALTGLSTLFGWGAICICHIRFRRAWKVQGHHVDELPFRAAAGEYGSYFGLLVIALVFIAQFYIALWPLGGPASNPADRVQDFFLSYLAAPVFLFFLITGYAINRTWPLRASEIDIDTGRKTFYTAEEMNAWRRERRNAPWHIRLFRMLFTY
ncbi:Amino-acid permease inda1 [Rhodotorula toruloides]